MEEDMRMLNITEDVAEDRKQWRQLMSNARSGKLGMLNDDDDDDYDDERYIKPYPC